ncbi:MULTISPECIES: sigma 54-interacting transcriptional regulator [unclassified Caballeronia]|uniref:sigma 54-interacting transcriptional regulator n=1 Tax=unclassified Caballeronia TaxID=2646786 RepID=UPI0020281CA6|nr:MULTISPECIES: sigma 54-interacting transcriptional regulator [unclassified Caballeronia]MDR5765867.1 sigma 54-interacting transcriptional regulator [Caballeronia sp. LZ028]
MTVKIGFIVPSEEMRLLAIETLSGPADIKVRVGLVTDADGIAAELVADGAEVIVARAETARSLKRSPLRAPIVEVPITISDLIYAIEVVKPHGPKVGVVCFPTMVYDLEWVGNLLGVELRKYFITNSDDVESAILNARKDGHHSIIGGGISVKCAARHGINAGLIPMGREAINLASQQAHQIAAAMDLARERSTIFSAVFDNAHEGIVVTDYDGNITAFNPSAERLTRIPRARALGANVNDVWPSLQLPSTTRSESKEPDAVVEVGGARLVCVRAPIVANKKVIGAVATFQEVDRIEKMEASIRRRTYAKGHVANFTFEHAIGKSAAIAAIEQVAKDYAASSYSVLILGETGTGKEVFAQSIHNCSKVADGPFVAINCASLPGQILESELFGYVAGAFTGASRDGKPGLFEVAHNGTIFLDEIGEMDYGNQGRLLRFLQERTVRRLGSDRNVPVNVRIIAATNKNLQTLVAEKSFREDLFYRLNVLTLTLPPLRDRAGDVRLFANSFLNQYGRENGKQLSMEPAALKRLELHPWPGNVRELEHCMARLVITSKSQRISAQEVDQILQLRAPEKESSHKVTEIIDALTACRGKYSEAASMLGVNRSTLWRWIKQYGLQDARENSGK